MSKAEIMLRVCVHEVTSFWEGDMAKILVADDDNTMLNLLTTLLQLEGDDPITAREAGDVLALAQSEQPDLILMDVHLRDGNTLSILRSLRSDAKTCEIPILMTSGMDVRDKALAGGADDFILKPFRPGDLLDRIHGMVKE